MNRFLINFEFREMGSESLPEWALLALEKRARLLESALTDENTQKFLELEPGKEGQVLQELQQATHKAANSEEYIYQSFLQNHDCLKIEKTQ